MRSFALALIISWVPALSAQQVGGVSVRLGDPQRSVLAKFSALTVVQSPNSGDYWSISDTTKWHGTPNYGNVGGLGFSNGVLTSVNRNWEATAQDGVGAIGLVLSLLRQLEGEPRCLVQSQRVNSPEVQGDFVDVRCGNHAISAGVSTQAGTRFYHLNESWVRRVPGGPQ